MKKTTKLAFALLCGITASLAFAGTQANSGWSSGTLYADQTRTIALGGSSRDCNGNISTWGNPNQSGTLIVMTGACINGQPQPGHQTGAVGTAGSQGATGSSGSR